jgi:CubicO group peptidase (beta-lactamase class C family)
MAAAGLLLAACGPSGPGASSTVTTRPGASAPPTATTAPATTAAPAGVRKVYPTGAFDTTDAALDARVRAAGLSVGMIRIVDADGNVVHEHGIGGMTGSTPLGIASSTKWLTAATFLTFVDKRAVGLDDDIAKWLPEFAGSNITARELLDHTSGVHDNPCQTNGTPLATCVRTLASSPREFAAGRAFSYGNSPFLVVGRLVEVLGNADFATVVRQQLTGPLGMDDTTWPGAPGAASPAFGARVTVDDYGKLLDMVLHGGTHNGTRVLSSDAVQQMITNQVGAYDTTHDYSVGITQIPRYGLGCWPDVVDGAGKTVVVSGNGGEGFYPWVDLATRTWGIVGLDDTRGAQYAVPASQQVEVEARTAVSR